MTGFQFFKDLNLSDSLLKSINEKGYEKPTQIQSETIPLLLAGSDLIGQAQTGTGKTAAFALPLLEKIEEGASKLPQILVMAPTRELAIQVAESFRVYGKYLTKFNVATIYGGQHYDIQFKQLKKNPQVVVGTPGRMLDHINRKTLNLNNVKGFVLDEADEMLKMGFIEDVEKVLGCIHQSAQIAMFSATMPPAIKKIAKKYLKDPEEVHIASTEKISEQIDQKYLPLKSNQKNSALIRILESEEISGALIFVKTKATTVSLSDVLETKGFSVSPLNGDMTQSHREETLRRLKNSKLDVIVATDVAARGLDVEHLNLVVNYDIPFEAESYVHRIGRTGRAGREGKAISFVTKRDIGLLRAIERTVKKKIGLMKLPTVDDIIELRRGRFKQKIYDQMKDVDLDFYKAIFEEMIEEGDKDPLDLSATLCSMAQGGNALQLSQKMDDIKILDPFEDSKSKRSKPDSRRKGKGSKKAFQKIKLNTYRVDLGNDDGIRKRELVKAIINATGIDGDFIGRVVLKDKYSTVDLPADLPKKNLNDLKNASYKSKKLNIKKFNSTPRKDK
ncbi:MAG: ATP-dependent RNA helicase [Planctomycetota bacterium]|nr:MAG: ATP-dependent RNA helicase [Planctomycetota bacterium]